MIEIFSFYSSPCLYLLVVSGFILRFKALIIIILNERGHANDTHVH